jgi:predicted dehydrogenase
MHELIAGGVVGRVTRVTMVRTDWFRSMTYYRSSAWRATWAGEGGGIIVNQSPHDLDLINWLAGLPSEVYAEINTLGHDIEVEDDVVALLKWSNGATGSLHVTTNEAPGTNSIEIAGTRATLLYQKGKLRVTELTSDAREFSETTKEKMSGPPIMSVTGYEIPDTDRFLKMSQNMVAAIRKGVPLVCPAEDGVKEVELANALLISGVKRKWVKTPPSRREFDSTLAKLIELKSLTKAKAHYAR